MIQTDHARIVNVSSDHHAHCKKLNVDDLNFEHDSSVGKMSSLFKIYGISKLCNVLFSLELANKLKPLGENFLFTFLVSRAILVESKTKRFKLCVCLKIWDVCMGIASLFL